MKHKSFFTTTTYNLIGLTTLATSMLFMSSSYAEDSVITSTTITISSACSISSNNTLPHTATILPGHEGTEIGSTTMTAHCNDVSGSAIYAVGYSNDTWRNTYLIDSSTNNTIPTGTGTSSSNWSMKLSIPTGNTAPIIRSDSSYDYTDYEVVPSDYTLVASFPSNADGANNSSFLVTYRAYINGAQAPGTYIGKVKYTLVHPSNSPAPTIYDITYIDASNDSTGVPEGQTGSISGNGKVELNSTEPTRDNYVFMGWCTTNNSSDTSACSGTIYEAGGNYTITSSGSDVAVTLYAVWAYGVCDSNTPYMQSWDNANALTVEKTIYLRDQRDNQCYTVAKLKDNKVWMTTNLNLAGGTRLYPETTDMASDYTLPTARGFQTNNRLPASSLSGYNSNLKAVLYNTGNTTNCYDSSTQKVNQTCHSFYSWPTATLSSGQSISNNTEAPYSICPKGWRLPIQKFRSDWKTGEFYEVATAYGADLESNYSASPSPFFTAAGNGTVANFVLSSNYYSSSSTNSISLNTRPYTGYLWSSTAHTCSGDSVNTGVELEFWSGGSVTVADHMFEMANAPQVLLPVRCIKSDNQ